MEAPVAMRESMTTTMPSPPDWRSVVFSFSMRFGRRRRKNMRRSAPSFARDERKQKRARDNQLRSNSFSSRNGKKKEPNKTAPGRRRLEIFRFPISFDPTGPHFGREREKKKRASRDRLKEHNHAPERRCSRTCARREALFFFYINANKRVCVLC